MEMRDDQYRILNTIGEIMKSGFIGIIGRPNAGKSTLLNNVLGEKIAITSDKPQTTRNRITGIYTDLELSLIHI